MLRIYKGFLTLLCTKLRLNLQQTRLSTGLRQRALIFTNHHIILRPFKDVAFNEDIHKEFWNDSAKSIIFIKSRSTWVLMRKFHLFTLIRSTKFSCSQTKSLRIIWAFSNFCTTPYSGWCEQNNLFHVFVPWNTGCQWYCRNGQIGISFTHGSGGSSISSTGVTVFFLQLRWGANNYFRQFKQVWGRGVP